MFYLQECGWNPEHTAAPPPPAPPAPPALCFTVIWAETQKYSKTDGCTQIIHKILIMWGSYISIASKVKGQNKRIEPDPVISVFGVTPSNSGLSKHHSDFIAFSTLLARRLILFVWKLTTPPSHSHWVREVMAFLKLEKIRCTIQGSVKRLKKLGVTF